MQLPSRSSVLVSLTLGLVLAAGCSVPFSEDETQVLLVNERNATYQVTAFQPEEARSTGLVFNATTESGERQYVGSERLRSGPSYTNVTPVDPERSIRLTALPEENSTQFVDNWNESQRTVYIVETYRDELVEVYVVECDRDMALRFTTAPDGEFETTSRCVQDVHA